ncbi:unnamed protein product [Amoebophrya sp. A25]|nr:unnamed protein product [Amoebophrya sp. A25]|eukprot:GSA25T00020086001.1
MNEISAVFTEDNGIKLEDKTKNVVCLKFLLFESECEFEK